MGKIRTRMLGMEDIEDKQKRESKERAQEKKQRERLRDESADIDVAPREKVEEPPSKKKIRKNSVSRRKNHGGRSVARRGKNYRNAVEAVKSIKVSSFEEAIASLARVSFVSFDESVELHVVVDKTGIRGEFGMPHSVGKSVRVRIADDAVVQEIEAGTFDFDILVAHPSFMPKLVKFAKVLGPRGIMPNPKTGTVSQDPEAVAKKLSSGLTRWKTESKQPLVHQLVGKMSHDHEAVVENCMALINAIGKKRIVSCHVTSTMGPSIKIDMSSIQ